MGQKAVEIGKLASGRVRKDWQTLAAYGLMVMLIGANFVAVRLSNLGLPPFWGAGIRFGAAALVFLIYAAIRRIPLPTGRALTGAILFGVLQYGLFYALAYYALMEVPAGLLSVIAATSPVFTLLFASAAGLELLTRQRVLGAAAAFAGVAFLFGAWAGKEIPLPYLLAGLAANLVACLAAVLFKLLPPVQPHVMNGVGMLSGALILLGLSFATGEKAALPSNFSTWAAFLYLVVLGSVSLFALFLFVLKRWTASAVAYQTVLSPIVTILLAAWLLAESVSGRLLIGSLMVFSGVYIGSLSPAARTRPENREKERPAGERLKAPCHPC